MSPVTSHSHLQREPHSPGYNAFSITPSDDDLVEATRGVYVGSPGNLKVVMTGGGSAQTFTNVQAGTLLPISVTKVQSTASVAGAIMGIY